MDLNQIEHIPDNWNEMSRNEKDLWFSRRYIIYTREGETAGLREWAPQDVKDAYAAFLKGEKE